MRIFILFVCFFMIISNAQAESRCLDISDKMIGAISEKLNAGVAKAVKSNDFESVYFIAVQISSSNDIGIWTSNSLDAGQGMIFSVNDKAVSLSSWPDGRNPSFKISKNDDGYIAAVECVINDINKGE